MNVFTRLNRYSSVPLWQAGCFFTGRSPRWLGGGSGTGHTHAQGLRCVLVVSWELLRASQARFGGSRFRSSASYRGNVRSSSEVRPRASRRAVQWRQATSRPATRYPTDPRRGRADVRERKASSSSGSGDLDGSRRSRGRGSPGLRVHEGRPEVPLTVFPTRTRTKS